MTLLYALDLLGTAAFAASGALAGIRRNMDLFGVLVLGLVTATGGGTLRDLLLGDLPPFILKDETYIYLAGIVALAVFATHRWKGWLADSMQFFDALGLGTFVVIGTSKALSFELGLLGSIGMGVMTATAGGVIRDVLANEIPLILRREIYASACIAGALLLVILKNIGLPSAPVALLAAITVIIIRLIAIRRNWALPRAKNH